MTKNRREKSAGRAAFCLVPSSSFCAVYCLTPAACKQGKWEEEHCRRQRKKVVVVLSVVASSTASFFSFFLSLLRVSSCPVCLCLWAIEKGKRESQRGSLGAAGCRPLHISVYCIEITLLLWTTKMYFFAASVVAKKNLASRISWKEGPDWSPTLL